MKFLKIYNIKDVFNNINRDFANDNVNYFMQPDVRDYHVFRVIKGDYEGNTDNFTVEEQLISKDNIIEQLGGDPAEFIRIFGDTRSALNGMDPLEIAKAVCRLDVEEGFSNNTYLVFDTIEEAIDSITDSKHHEIETVIFEDTDPQEGDDEGDKDIICLHHSLKEAHKLLDFITSDERATLFEDVTIHSFQNGREQGLILKYQDKDTKEYQAITFATYRSSDSIIIYHGPFSEISASEGAYSNSKSFYWRHFNKAKSYIFDILENHAIKSSTPTPFGIHPGLEVATEIVDLLLADSRVNNHRGRIECLQDVGLNGYAVSVWDASYQDRMISFSKDSDDTIALFTGSDYFQGLAKDAKKETFSISDKKQVVERIFNIIEEVTTKKESVK